jgi:hypothetical protein
MTCAGVEREKFVKRFVKEVEPGIFHIIAMEGWKQPSEDGRGRVILDRIVLREVVCRSWGEESYELLYNVDEGKGFESMQVCKRAYLEMVGAIGPSEKKDILMVIRELPREELDKLWPFELDDLGKVIEKYGVRRTIGEILDYVRSMALDVLPREGG